MGLADALEVNRRGHVSFEFAISAPPVFAVGDDVTTKGRMHSGHTRLPAYARGARAGAKCGGAWYAPACDGRRGVSLSVPDGPHFCSCGQSSSFMPRDSPIPPRISLISFRDFRPKFFVFSISASVFCTSSPMVRMFVGGQQVHPPTLAEIGAGLASARVEGVEIPATH